MIIDVTDSVRFRYEDKNYMLERKRVVQEGKNAGAVQWDTVGYYGDLKTMAQSLLVRHLDLLVGDMQIGAVRDLKCLIDAVDCGADLIARVCSSREA